MPNYLTTTEAAARAGYKNTSTIRRAILNQWLKAAKRGHDWWIDERDLKRWMAADCPIYPPKNTPR